jgi:hypothetical protein
MYFIDKYYKCYYNSDKCLYIFLFDVGQREGIVFIYVSYLTRESTLYFLNVNTYWKRWEKDANIVKGARFCYCRIYHKFVNFIILNLFKVVKWTSCFILIWNRHGHECSRIWKLSGNFIKKCRDFLGRI